MEMLRRGSVLGALLFWKHNHPQQDSPPNANVIANYPYSQGITSRYITHPSNIASAARVIQKRALLSSCTSGPFRADPVGARMYGFRDLSGDFLHVGFEVVVFCSCAVNRKIRLWLLNVFICFLLGGEGKSGGGEE